jgi:CSLREA domain-containing protein
MIQTIAKEKKGAAWAMKVLATGVLAAALLAGLPAQQAHAADTFTVDQTVDTPDANVGDGDCDVSLAAIGFQCTLRAAIEEANATPEPDLIRFSIPDAGSTGVKTINVGGAGFGALPPMTKPVTIDGYTQPGASPNTLADGTNAKLMIELNGTAAPNSDGLVIDSSSNSVVKGLVINRFGNQGIEANSDASNVRIEGNFVGTDPSGTIALGNRGDGMEIDASNSTVGGSTPDKRNLISGNDVDGLSISSAKDIRIENNLIGTKKDSIGNLGNGFNGVDVSGNDATGNRILTNSISSNGQLGIDLGVDGRTSNDLGDADSGANRLQNFPALSSAKTGKKGTTVNGKLNSQPNTAFIVQFFSNSSGTDEGKKFIGQKSVSTDSSGNVSFNFKPASKVGKGQKITATATNNATGDTSEFSAAKKVVAS